MKLVHTADLHIGKIVNEISMLSDQRYILEQIIAIVKEEQADGILIAGDVYDRSIPPAEAVTVLDWFFSTLIANHVDIYVISGNHDSAERVGFASKILDANGLYISSTYDGTVKRVSKEAGEQRVDLYLLPFVKPQVVEHYEQSNRLDSEERNVAEKPIRTFDEGVRASLSHVEIDPSAVNILLTHHFVTAGGVEPEQSDSENSLSLGGIDQVDASVFDDFDYVALGHIHRPQRIGRDTIRYAGSPLKYSFSEVLHKKSVTIIEIGPEKSISVRIRELQPLHDMRKIKGKLEDLMNPECYQQTDTTDYIQATLTDDIEIMDPIGKLRTVYPNTMQIIMEKNQMETNITSSNLQQRKQKTPVELFDEFYSAVTGREFDDVRKGIMQEIVEEVLGGGTE